MGESSTLLQVRWLSGEGSGRSVCLLSGGSRAGERGAAAGSRATREPQSPDRLSLFHVQPLTSLEEVGGGAVGRGWGLFQPKGAGLLHGGQHLLEQHGEGRVRRQVQAVEAGVGSAVTTTVDQLVQFTANK